MSLAFDILIPVICILAALITAWALCRAAGRE
jgi:hypothetical protein